VKTDKDGNPIVDPVVDDPKKTADDEGGDKGDDLSPEQQKVADKIVADAEAAGKEVDDAELQTAIDAMRGKPEAKAKEPEAKKDKDGNMVPQSRFDEATGLLKDEIKDLTDRLDAQEQKTAPAAEDPVANLKAQIEEAEDMRDDALLDGDKETAKAAREVCRELQEELQQHLLSGVTAQARTQSSEDSRYNTALLDLEAVHPEVNPDSDTFNKETMQRIARISKGLQTTGSSPTDALKEAAELVLPKKDTSVEDNLRDRDTKSRKDAAKIVAGQAPDLKDVGSPRGGVDPVIKASKLNDAQFDKLPEDVRQQLRGDNFVPGEA
jgi:hypothetical protein